MSQRLANVTLGVVAIVWGATFVLVKNELPYASPLNFVAWRFLSGAVVLVVVMALLKRRPSRREIVAGMIVGLFLGSGYIFQTIGLGLTTAGKAGFLTGISVVLVPLAAALFFRRYPTRQAVIGVCLASVGLWFLSIQSDFTFATGDLWVLGCAFAFTGQIVFIEAFTQSSRPIDPMMIGVGQVVWGAVVAWVVLLSVGDVAYQFPASTWGAILFMGTVATALIFVVQSFAQRFTSSTQVALIFSLEPVAAGLFGWWFLAEEMTSRELFGCVLILVGMLVAELRFKRRRSDLLEAKLSG